MTDRRAQRATNKNYAKYSAKMIRRLDGFYGRVDARMNSRIADWVTGTRVLEIGCGFGQLVDYLRQKGFSSVGTDLIEELIMTGRIKFPKADLRVSPSGVLNYPSKSFDTLILKETIHHIYGESDLHEFLKDAKRICCRRIIVMDPNPMLILLLARIIIRHRDPVCPMRIAEGVLRQTGFQIIYKSWSDPIAFPLSGGLVGKPFIPNNWIGDWILKIDNILEICLRRLRLAQFFCWRYLLVADLPRYS